VLTASGCTSPADVTELDTSATLLDEVQNPTRVEAVKRSPTPVTRRELQEAAGGQPCGGETCSQPCRTAAS